jgi:fibro-slime domain-containing protein
MRVPLLAILALAACSNANGDSENLNDNDGGFNFDGDVTDTTGTGGLDGKTNPGDGAVSGDAGRCGTALLGVLRDFKEDHPDFEDFLGSDRGIVKNDLGADNKPVYNGDTPTTTGAANFDQWFRDVDGVNKPFNHTITLSKMGSVYTFENNAFFPLDSKGWGNEGHEHNYHFTYELHTTFRYQGGETFTFTGDDDLFVFVNKKLAIDLGGVHGSETGSINLDADAGKLSLTKGQIYQLDFFFAERHTVDSHFRIDTTLDFVDCGTGIK